MTSDHRTRWRQGLLRRRRAVVATVLAALAGFGVSVAVATAGTRAHSVDLAAAPTYNLIGHWVMGGPNASGGVSPTESLGGTMQITSMDMTTGDFSGVATVGNENVMLSGVEHGATLLYKLSDGAGSNTLVSYLSELGDGNIGGGGEFEGGRGLPATSSGAWTIEQTQTSGDASAPAYNLTGGWIVGVDDSDGTSVDQDPNGNRFSVTSMDMGTGDFSGTATVDGSGYVLSGTEQGDTLQYQLSLGSSVVYTVTATVSFRGDGDLGASGTQVDQRPAGPTTQAQLELTAPPAPSYTVTAPTYDLTGDWTTSNQDPTSGAGETFTIATMDMASGAFTGTATDHGDDYTVSGTETGTVAQFTMTYASGDCSAGNCGTQSNTWNLGTLQDGDLGGPSSWHGSPSSGTYTAEQKTAQGPTPTGSTSSCSEIDGGTSNEQFVCHVTVTDATGVPPAGAPSGTVSVESSDPTGQYYFWTPVANPCTLGVNDAPPGVSNVCGMTLIPENISGSGYFHGTIDLQALYGGDRVFAPSDGVGSYDASSTTTGTDTTTTTTTTTTGTTTTGTEPSATQVNCSQFNVDTPNAFFQCTAQVADSGTTTSPQTPTGVMTFALTPGGQGGLAGNMCGLGRSQSGPTAYCSVNYNPPSGGLPAGTPAPVMAVYPGSSYFAPSTGTVTSGVATIGKTDTTIATPTDTTITDATTTTDTTPPIPTTVQLGDTTTGATTTTATTPAKAGTQTQPVPPPTLTATTRQKAESGLTTAISQIDTIIAQIEAAPVGAGTGAPQKPLSGLSATSITSLYTNLQLLGQTLPEVAGVATQVNQLASKSVVGQNQTQSSNGADAAALSYSADLQILSGALSVLEQELTWLKQQDASANGALRAASATLFFSPRQRLLATPAASTGSTGSTLGKVAAPVTPKLTFPRASNSAEMTIDAVFRAEATLVGLQRAIATTAGRAAQAQAKELSTDARLQLTALARDDTAAAKGWRTLDARQKAVTSLLVSAAAHGRRPNAAAAARELAELRHPPAYLVTDMTRLGDASAVAALKRVAAKLTGKALTKGSGVTQIRRAQTRFDTAAGAMATDLTTLSTLATKAAAALL